jgi:hypothetical protein
MGRRFRHQQGRNTMNLNHEIERLTRALTSFKVDPRSRFAFALPIAALENHRTIYVMETALHNKVILKRTLSDSRIINGLSPLKGNQIKRSVYDRCLVSNHNQKELVDRQLFSPKTWDKDHQERGLNSLQLQ